MIIVTNACDRKHECETVILSEAGRRTEVSPPAQSKDPYWLQLSGDDGSF